MNKLVQETTYAQGQSWPCVLSFRDLSGMLAQARYMHRLWDRKRYLRSFLAATSPGVTTTIAAKSTAAARVARVAFSQAGLTGVRVGIAIANAVVAVVGARRITAAGRIAAARRVTAAGRITAARRAATACGTIPAATFLPAVSCSGCRSTGNSSRRTTQQAFDIPRQAFLNSLGNNRSGWFNLVDGCTRGKAIGAGVCR
jgi:hypothetical protein